MSAMGKKTNRRKSKRSGRGFFLFGFGIILGVFGGLLAWSVFAPFEGAVLASGSIAVEDQNKAVQHLEGGIVAEIQASEGASVAAGDLLIRLDGTSVEAQLASLDAKIIDLGSREARLKAERDGTSRLQLRDELEPLEGVSELAEALRSQSVLLTTRKEARNTQREILGQRITQLERRIEGLSAEVVSKTDQRIILEEEATSVEQLVERGLSPRPRLLALQRAKSELLGQAESLDAEIAATEVRIGETALERSFLETGFREETIAELSAVQTELSSLLQDRRAAVDRLTRLDVRAPRSGYVLGARAQTIGGVIAPGEPIMYIVPRDDRLVASVRISPQDIDKIGVGQTARLRFSAFSQQETPEVDGIVLKVSADTFVDQSSGQDFYTVVVELPSQDPIGDGFDLVPGMPVDAMLKTESRNALSYLTKPLTDAINRTFRD